MKIFIFFKCVLSQTDDEKKAHLGLVIQPSHNIQKHGNPSEDRLADEPFFPTDAEMRQTPVTPLPSV